MPATEAQIAEFTKQRDEIYKRFRENKDLQTTGTKPGKVFADDIQTQGGILLAYRFEEAQAEQLEEFSVNLKEKVRDVVIYGIGNGHVTIGDYAVGDDFTARFDRSQISAITEKIAGSIDGILKYLHPVDIEFDQWLANANAVIAPGYANDAFVDNQVAIDDAVRSAFGKENNSHLFDTSKLNRGQMSHTTAARFTEQYTTVELASRGFFEYMASGHTRHLSNGKLNQIAVAYFTMSREDGFRLVTHYNISLYPELKEVLTVSETSRLRQEKTAVTY